MTSANETGGARALAATPAIANGVILTAAFSQLRAKSGAAEGQPSERYLPKNFEK